MFSSPFTDDRYIRLEFLVTGGPRRRVTRFPTAGPPGRRRKPRTAIYRLRDKVLRNTLLRFKRGLGALERGTEYTRSGADGRAGAAGPVVSTNRALFPRAACAIYLSPASAWAGPKCGTEPHRSLPPGQSLPEPLLAARLATLRRIATRPVLVSRPQARLVEPAVRRRHRHAKQTSSGRSSTWCRDHPAACQKRLTHRGVATILVQLRFRRTSLPCSGCCSARSVASASLMLSDLDTYWSLGGLVPEDDDSLGLKALFRKTGLGDGGAAMLYAALLASFFGMTIGWKTGVTVTASLIASLVHVSWNSLPLSGAHLGRTGRALLPDLGGLRIGLVGRRVARSATRAGGRSAAGLSNCAAAADTISSRAHLFEHRPLEACIARCGATDPRSTTSSTTTYFTDSRFSCPSNLEWSLTLATYTTLTWELGFAPAMFHPISRRVFLVTGIFMHVGMAIFLEVGLFTYAMLCSYVAFLDPWRVSKQRWFPARVRVNDRFNGVRVRAAEATGSTAQRSDSS